MRLSCQILSLFSLVIPVLNVLAGGIVDLERSHDAPSSTPPPFHSIDWKKHQYRAPSKNDLRSPCPGLNTLANHGFLPRDGRGLTIENVGQAGLVAYNINPGLLALGAKIGMTASPNLNSTFTLRDILLHNSIEHNISYSRVDIPGDSLHFNETIFTALAESNPGVDYYNTTSAGQVQTRRLVEGRKVNPTMRETEKEFLVRSAEAAFYLSVMGDPVTGIAPKRFVNVFFREERLPLKEGWKRAVNQFNTTTIGPLVGAIRANTDWHGDEGFCSSFSFASPADGDGSVSI